MSTSERRFERCLVLTAAGGGLGYCRPGPGTWSSVGAAALALVWLWMAPAGWQQAGFIVAAVMAVLLGLLSCPSACRHFERHDPAQVVIDEMAGTWLGLALIPSSLLAGSPLLAVLAVLVLFRVFDIAKPWPVPAVERLPVPYGVMADDLVAGLWAGLLAIPLLL